MDRAKPDETREPTAAYDIAVYDLDGVITRRDTFAALLGARGKAAPFRVIAALPKLIAWAVARDPHTQTARSRGVTAALLRGVNVPEYEALASLVGERIGADARWFRWSVVDRMRAQRAAGVTVIIATASEERLVRALLGAAGIEYDALSASTLAHDGRGMRFADHRVWERKAEALVAAGVELSRAEFATDSFTDAPTARLAANTLLVGASERTVQRFAEATIVAQMDPRLCD